MGELNFQRVVQSVTAMLEDLDKAIHISRDTADTSSPTLAIRSSRGKRGRPRVIISPDLLIEGSRLGTNTELAEHAHCHPRTIRRRKLEAGLSQPGVLVKTVTQQADGSQVVRYQNTRPEMSAISDTELDGAVGRVLQDMPGFGRKMIEGSLRALGLRIPQSRVRESLLRVRGVPGIFGDRRIHRREYRVAGPNSLCHHDGQHGMFMVSSHLLLFLGCPIVSRSDPLEIRHSYVYRWILSNGRRDPRQQ
jgi:hypothetical protein